MKSLIHARVLLSIASVLISSGGIVSANTCSFQAPEDSICLQNSDFTDGTLIIDTPGKYKLCEDIEFDPNPPNSQVSPAEAYEPDFSVYDKNNYGLGFFAAIAIGAQDVEIYLNCHTIKQSKGHALMQRFFAVIELASSPFIPNVGPAQFVGENSPSFVGASNVLIQGPGTIGLSSHHGVHGNENSNITIQQVTFEDFEVAATSLNNVDTLTIKDCKIKGNRQDVPIVGLFSAARNIIPYGKKLKELGYSTIFSGETVTAEDAYDDLVSMVNNVFNDIVTGSGFIDSQLHQEEFHLFDNEFKVVDGPCYAFLVHGKGPAVGGQGFTLADDDTLTSSNISIENNIINNVKCWTNEVPATVVNGVVINDARGAVFQTVKVTDVPAERSLAITAGGKYRRNPVADMQIMTAKAIQDGVLLSSPELQTAVNTIDATIINWAAADPASPEASFSPSYRCNGDSMHHVSKGMIMIRVEDTLGFTIANNTIDAIENLSKAPFGTSSTFGTCADFHAGASIENSVEQQAGNVRAISASAVKGYEVKPKKKSEILLNSITNVVSNNANVIVGIDIQGESEGVFVDENVVNLFDDATDDIFDQYIAFRCREFSRTNNNGIKSVEIGDLNVFAQESQVLHRRLRSSSFLESHKNIEIKSEWEVGGCPFARGVAY